MDKKTKSAGKSKLKAKASKSLKQSKKKPSSKKKVINGSLFAGIRLLKYSEPIDVYACSLPTAGGSCGTCFSSYTC
ncbi:MAG: hypothetical protein H7235_02990 [Bdellovibrionaceae bacterium]|nr:hypothetical protein [Pseudobdellovibrionaceae bacterium]